MRARILTLNLAGLQYQWFERRARVVGDGLAPLGIDVACLQETALRWLDDEAAVYDQARALGDALGLRYVAFAPYSNPVEVVTQEKGGVAIVSRWPLRVVRSQQLPGSSTYAPDGRVVLAAALEVRADALLHVLTTHFFWPPEHRDLRRQQMDLCLAELRRLASPPARAVIAGDFNATADEPAIQLAYRELRDAWSERHPGRDGFTWERKNPLAAQFGVSSRRIDYVLCSPDTRVREARLVLTEPDPVPASDHLGLMTDLAW